MSSYFLGVDIGATKTDALIADEAGHALGMGRTGPGNQQTVGYEGMEAAIREATGQALAASGLSIERIEGAGFGIAGFDWPSQRPQMLASIHKALKIDGRIAIANDAVLGLLAGTDTGWGVALAGGTSNNCRGRDPQGREGRVTGDGSQFGEYGGAYELATKALHVVTAAWTMRGPATALTGALIRYLGASDLDDMLEGLALGRYRVGADAAPLVFQVAEAGDSVAREVIAWSGRELGSLAVGVIRQLGFEQSSFDVVLMGSLFNGGPLFIEPVRDTILAEAPSARLVRLSAPPVIGGVMLGMEQAGVNTARVREKLAESAGAHRKIG